MSEPIPDDDLLGPMDYLAVEFPGGRVTGAGFAVLLDLVERGAVRVLDLEFLAKNAGGDVKLVGVQELDIEPGVDLSPFVGASSGLLDHSDIEVVAAALEPGGVAAMLVYEELSALPMIAAWQREGARMIIDGPVTPEDIVQALDSTERD